MTAPVQCPVCCVGESGLHAVIAGHPYYCCAQCGSIHVDPQLLAELDAGSAQIGEYGEEYWEQERVGAMERAGGIGLCRVGEAILYCRRPVRRFLDIGAGAGFLLGKLHDLLDPDAEIFHGVEKYPPPYAQRVENFHVGGIESLTGSFDAGACIEVVEHLTPLMLDGLVAGMAKVSVPGSFWLFNTGMPDYVRDEDPDYLDPIERGHIVSYSLAGLAGIFGRHGFLVGGLPGKSFAFYAEFRPLEEIAFEARIYGALPENTALLQRHGLLYHAAFESARSYMYYSGYLERTRWAQSLQAQLISSAS